MSTNPATSSSAELSTEVQSTEHPSPHTQPAIAVRNLSFTWPGQRAPVLRIGQFQVERGERVLLLGPSGSGKSTLLSLLAGVLVAGTGQVALAGQDWAALSGRRRDAVRADRVGYVFQQFNLLPWLTVRDNVLLGVQFSAQRRMQSKRRFGSVVSESEHWLEHMGLDGALRDRPAGLISVGQQQRVAAARALMGAPEVLIADEPTSALDSDRRDAFLDTLLGACSETASTLLLVSHDRSLAQHFGRTEHLTALSASTS